MKAEFAVLFVMTIVLSEPDNAPETVTRSAAIMIQILVQNGPEQQVVKQDKLASQVTVFLLALASALKVQDNAPETVIKFVQTSTAMAAQNGAV